MQFGLEGGQAAYLTVVLMEIRIESSTREFSTEHGKRTK
jgi:hypothetical protein